MGEKLHTNLPSFTFLRKCERRAFTECEIMDEIEEEYTFNIPPFHKQMRKAIMIIPTFAQLLHEYKRIAVIERLKSHRPSNPTVVATVKGIHYILKGCGVSCDLPINSLTRRMIDDWCVQTLKKGQTALTVNTYLAKLRAVMARWTMPYYHEAGFEIIPFDIPRVRCPPNRYSRPDRKLLDSVKSWYENLRDNKDWRMRVVAMMMLEFAMRNGDIIRLKWSAFHVKKDESGTERAVICYTPRKTKLSSGRIVAWPIHPLLWDELKAYRHSGELVVPHAGHVLKQVNKEMRRLGFYGSKASYELRKICIDHVYQRYGAEMASSISGDNIQTIIRFYIDPSAVNFENIRVIDLI